MSIFDDDIINKDPEELIWAWLENHYTGEFEGVKNNFKINKKGCINILRNCFMNPFKITAEEIIPSYIKFNNNNLTRKSIKFITNNISENNKDLYYKTIIGDVKDTHIKSYSVLIFGKSVKNVIIDFVGHESWLISSSNLENLKEITVNANDKYVGEVMCQHAFNVFNSDNMNNIKYYAMDFFQRHPRCKKIRVEDPIQEIPWILFERTHDSIRMVAHDKLINNFTGTI